jgi:hypothetical protein
MMKLSSIRVSSIASTILRGRAYRLRHFVAAFALVAICIPAHAADVNARIRGTVTDPAGAVVANATVVAKNTATGVKFETTSQANGG